MAIEDDLFDLGIVPYPTEFPNEDDVIQFIMSNTEEHSSNLGTLEKQTICSLLKIAHCINKKNQKEEDLKKAKEI
jgi:hypothetical protein